jgi:hypothetical protein
VGYTDTRKAQTAIHMVWIQSGENAAVWAKAPEKMRFVKKMPTANNYEKWLMRVRISSSNGKP